MKPQTDWSDTQLTSPYPPYNNQFMPHP